MFSGKYRALVHSKDGRFQLIEFDTFGPGTVDFDVIRTFSVYAEAENVGLITECGSGRIFALTGAGPNADNENWWQMMDISKREDETITSVMSKRPGFYENCKGRAAATGFVDAQGRLIFGCNEMKDRDGSGGWADWREYTVR